MTQRRLEYVRLDELRRHPRNPEFKDHDEAGIAASVNRHGFVEPPIVDERTDYLLGGHGRLEHLETARDDGQEPPEGIDVADDGMWLVPTILGWSSRSDAEALALMVALNRLPEAGGWKPRGLADLLDEISHEPLGLDGTGFSDVDLDAMLAELNAEERPDPWSDRRKAPMPDARGLANGEVWDVGPHRIVIGDARDDACWSVLPQAQLVVMDPPYGISYGGGGLEREAIEGDGSPEEAIALLEAVVGQIVKHVAPGAACYTFLAYDGDCFPPMLQALAAVGLARWHLVWIKNNATFGRADYHFQHENIAYGWTAAGSRLRPVENRKLTSVWRVDRPSASEDHPTAKPLAVCSIPIEASSWPGDVVMDPFAGSGSTLVAAAAAGRTAAGIEVRPEYARVALDRLEKLTGVDAVRVH